jgi:hypothetical protein
MRPLALRPLALRPLAISAVLSASLLSGCAYWPFESAPKHAQILVSTVPPGASCTLTRGGQPIATAAPTPAIALVDPALADLAVTCRRHGFEEVAVALPPRPSSTYQQQVEIALAPRPPGAPR